MPIRYSDITTITALDLPVPEFDIACFDDVSIQSQIEVIPDPIFFHSITLANIDISANLFKKIFYDTPTTTIAFNQLTKSYTDHVFGVIPAPPTSTDITYNIPGFSNPIGYYSHLLQYISLLIRNEYQTNNPFSLQEILLENIAADLATAYPSFLSLFNTCSFITFMKEMTNIKSLNDLIPSASSQESTSLNWSNILELVRQEYNEVVGGVNQWTDTAAYAVLKITLVVKTTINLAAMAVPNIVSTTEIIFRFNVNFSELAEFQALNESNGNLHY
jgi:hypothetical protein